MLFAMVGAEEEKSAQPAAAVAAGQRRVQLPGLPEQPPRVTACAILARATISLWPG